MPASENGRHAVENSASFLLNIFRQFASLGVNAEAAGDVERVPDQYAIAEGSLDRLRQIDVTPSRLRTIRRLSGYGNTSRDD